MKPEVKKEFLTIAGIGLFSGVVGLMLGFPMWVAVLVGIAIMLTREFSMRVQK